MQLLRKYKWYLVVFFLLVFWLTLLFNFDDCQQYLPQCLIKKVFNINCPSCGTQRAIHLLVHGEFLAAFRCNPFAFFTLCYFCAFFMYVSFSKSKRLESLLLISFLSFYFIWWIIRLVWNI